MYSMKKKEIPIPIHQLAFLQAYLYGVFAGEKPCNKNFSNTKWYLSEKYSNKDVNLILDFLKNKEIECDCDIIHKLDLRELSGDTIPSHVH
jgi:hypothetical protein